MNALKLIYNFLISDVATSAFWKQICCDSLESQVPVCPNQTIHLFQNLYIKINYFEIRVFQKMNDLIRKSRDPAQIYFRAFSSQLPPFN